MKALHPVDPPPSLPRTGLTRRESLVTMAAACVSGLGGCGRRSVADQCRSVTGPGSVPGERAHVRFPPPGSAGLDFPGSAAVRKTMRFRFLDPLPMYPATLIWRALPRRQPGYYTAFFWGNDDGKANLDTFLWLPGRDADSYYGAHPYPDVRPLGNSHQWEISIERHDFVNGAVDYDRWHTQAFRAWGNLLGKHHEYYWDLPLLDECHRVERTAPRSWGERRPPVPALTWGDAPWAPGKEVWNGVLRGIQIYSECLSVEEILAEVQRPLSVPRARESIWYLNLDPTPTDLADRSGRGHHPQWVGDERPALWTP